VLPIVIVGTGLAGYNLVKEFRKTDKDTPVIMLSQDDGRQYSKPMLSTGFSKGKDDAGLAMADAAAMAEQLNIEVRTHCRVDAINASQHLLHTSLGELAYQKLVLALGAAPITPPISGSEHLYTINDLQDYARFHQAVQGKKRILILGAGLVGTEYAHDLASAGYQVTLAAPDEHLLSRLMPEPAGDVIAQALQDLGVDLRLGQAVTGITAQGEGYVATLDGTMHIDADVVLSAVGLRPRTELASAAGLTCGRGIKVNRLLQTSAPDVYALGDCAEVDGLNLLYVLPLMTCARALAKTLSGTDTQVSYGVMPVMVKTPTLANVVCPPPAGIEGNWHVEQAGSDINARFIDIYGQLQGYALTGSCTAEKMALNGQLQPMLA
jgi:rubredoxin---NAD+ reductase